VTLLWFAQIAATSIVERLVLRAVRGFMRIGCTKGLGLNRYCRSVKTECHHLPPSLRIG